MAWLNLSMPNQTVKNGPKAKKINLNWIFSWKITNKTFMYLLVLFTLQNFDKNYLGRVMRMCHFRDQNDPFVMNIFFLVQTIISTFIFLLALFIVKNLKKFLQRIQSYDNAQFLGPKRSICSKCIFGKLSISFSSTY